MNREQLKQEFLKQEGKIQFELNKLKVLQDGLRCLESILQDNSPDIELDIKLHSSSMVCKTISKWSIDENVIRKWYIESALLQYPLFKDFLLTFGYLQRGAETFFYINTNSDLLMETGIENFDADHSLKKQTMVNRATKELFPHIDLYFK